MYIIKLKNLIIYLVLFCVFSVGFICAENKYISCNADDEETGVPLPVLMYHGLTTNPAKIGKYVISYDMFENDLKYLNANGYNTVLIQDLIDYVEAGTPLPDNPVLLTFDDGYYNNYLYGFELLKKYDTKAVISIIGTWTEVYSDNGELNPEYSHVTWEHIRQMQESGLVEVQNHSFDMHTLDKGRNGTKKKMGESVEAYTKVLTDDISRLQKRMEEETGVTPTCFTYPYGGISKDSLNIIKDMGFKASLSCEERLNYIRIGDSECLYKLNRYLRSDNSSAEEILKSLHK